MRVSNLGRQKTNILVKPGMARDEVGGDLDEVAPPTNLQSIC